MLLLNVVLISFYLYASLASSLDVLNGTELVFTFLVHRHGDRTPVQEYQYLSDRPELLDKIIAPLGYGQLTDLGKRRAYELGKFIRSRYNNYLSPKYNHSEIYIRSTDSIRAKMTVLVAMAAVYRPDGRGWSEDINWVPVPYTTVPLRYDFLMGFNCPKLDEYHKILVNTYVPEMAKYSDVLDRLSTALKQDILKSNPVKIFYAYDLFVSQTNMGISVKPSIQTMMPDIKEAADKAFDILNANDTMLPLQAGLLLKEFFEVSASAAAGEPTQTVRIYSAHDHNVYAFAAISKAVPTQGIPPYAGLFALELRRMVETGRYVVLPIYVRSPGEQVQYLEIQGCDGPLCDLKKFYAITSPYLLEVDEWKEKCNYDEDATFNSEGFD
ncbi:unnamed protein product [Parnassius apollo]|uniref:acid phosphatase n=1 Tax=Parnassius apollo TaxID=110799 RepID=A0A8S3XDQ0_PARAO|nr:unnamed protein product [Parnassius apollo]